MNIDPKFNLLPIIIVNRVEVFEEGVAHQESSLFWMVFVLARPDIDHAGFDVFVSVFISVYVIFKIPLRAQHKYTLIKDKLD